MRKQLAERARTWNVAIDCTLETEGSLLGFGTRRGQPVVLKLLKRAGDEWRSGEVLAAFDGQGMVRVYEHAEGALLLEWLRPGHSLAGTVLEGHDDTAIEILADVIQRLAPQAQPPGCPSAADWGKGFERYRQSGATQIPLELVEAAEPSYLALCASQRGARLLHGDLQHYNLLFDASRGWLAIDPKGVSGEPEYEVGALLRNPVERPELFASAAIVERRLNRLTRSLGLDLARALRWSFAQAVLSAIWDVEDGKAVDSAHPSLQLARAIRPMLPA